MVHLDLGKSDAADARPQNLEGGLLGTESSREVFDPPCAIRNLVTREDVGEEAITACLEEVVERLQLNTVDAYREAEVT